MNFEALKARFNAGRISAGMLRIYVRKGVITAGEFQAITGAAYA